jgi:glutamyl-tRNA synthetase
VTSPIRVRFAPSPTGYLHVGSARAALFNWLAARQAGGTMVLRIEDTDAERSRPELMVDILAALEWLGIDWDEGPIYQSERRDLYRAAAEKLLADGVAYLVDKDDNVIEGGSLDDGLAARFKMPQTGTTAFDDLIRGHVSFEHADLEDFVVWRSNGTPTFLLANAVDDADMGITHVIRGEDLISATPKVLLLRQALGHPDPPIFAHLPLLVNESRKKLSKRRDDVALSDYQDKGFLAEGMANYLALLGWGPPDEVEVRPMDEIVQLFRLEDVTKASAFFDLKKLSHVNAEWIRRLSPTEFTVRAQPWLDGDEAPWPAEAFDSGEFAKLAPLVQERVTTLSEVPGYVDWLFLPEPPVDEASWEKAMVKETAAAAILDEVIAAFEACEWEAETLKAVVLEVGERHERKLGKAQAPVRVAITGKTVGPPLFESLEVFGRERTLDRLRAARQKL